MTFSEIAKAYLKSFHTGSEADFWAWEKVDSICNNPDTAVDICVELANACQSNQELSYVAAGPFEDSLIRHGSIIIPAFKKAGLESEKVRIALSGAWIFEDQPIFEDWKQLMIEFAFWGHKPLSPLNRGWEPNKPEV